MKPASPSQPGPSGSQSAPFGSLARPWRDSTIRTTLTAHHWRLVHRGHWWYCLDANGRFLSWGAFPYTALRRALAAR